MPEMQVQLETVELLLAEQAAHADDEAPQPVAPKSEGAMLPAPHCWSQDTHASLIGAAMLLRKACRATQVHLVQLPALLGCSIELVASLSMLVISAMLHLSLQMAI